jgi:hypothetical protein
VTFVLPLHNPAREERYDAAVGAMHALDVINGNYRAAQAYDQKVAWMDMVWRNSVISQWLFAPGEDHWAHLDIGSRRTGGYYIKPLDRNGRGETLVTLEYGPQPATDLVLAESFASAVRVAGIFGGMTRTMGPVFDSGTVTLTTMALYVHDRSRAREFWDLAAAVRLPGRKPPFGTWKPKTWTS